MKQRLVPFVGWLALAVGAGAQDEAALEAALAQPSRESAASLFQLCVAEHGEVEPLILRLEEIVKAAADNPQRSAAAQLAAGFVHWQHGDMGAARKAFDGAVIATPEGLEVRLAQATILDSLGEVGDALKLYEALLPDLVGSAKELSVRMTVALLALEERGEERRDALAECARGLAPEERNRAAVVLALLDRPADALSLFEPRSQPKERVRDLLRMAGWALQAKEFGAAATHAWEASFLAPMARDRWQALALVSEAKIAEGNLEGMLELFAGRIDLTPQHQKVWTEVLRQTGKYGEAIVRFEKSKGEELTPEIRLELLELYREAGREREMLTAYEGLIAEDPQRVLWRSGLSRVYLEKGDTEAALATWDGFSVGVEAPTLMAGAQALADLGMVEIARTWGEVCEKDERTSVAAQLFLFALERDGGRVPEAIEVLRRMEASTDPGSPARLELSEAFEQVGALEDAVRVLESVKSTRPNGEAGEDLEMRLAWLYSEIEEEEKALEAWRDLWIRIEALARRRYVEDRLMTVSSRLGNLADLAIELEEAVLAGTASEKQSALLVRLYTRVGDSVSATEVVDEFFRHAGKGERASLEEKARIYLATHDYFAYEEAVRRLIELDPEGEPDYLRQLAMSMMERGKPRQARDVLGRLSELESDTLAAEFEAGVLALAGMREEALVVYAKGLAEHPGRIDGYLLMGDLLKQTGDQDRALGMFQYLAAYADRDDLFTVAIDGILNQFADGGVRPKTIAWARRATFMRLALRHDKTYLYQLLADLHEEEQDRVGMIRAHETSLPITGPRVASVLRELMDLSRGEGDTFRGSGWKGDKDLFLHYGRRLVASGEQVPPQVYLDLGEAFLEADDAEAARRTFALTRDMPEHARYQREAAALFEKAGETQIALESYQALLATAPTDESLLVKVGELHEATGQDERAADLYMRALELLLARRPLVVTQKADDKKPDSPFIWFGGRNTDDWDRWSSRILNGILASSSPEVLEAWFERLFAAQDQDLGLISALGVEPKDAVLATHPRVSKRAAVLRQFAFALRNVDLAQRADRKLIGEFSHDSKLAKTLVHQRVGEGYPLAAGALLDATKLSEKDLAALRAMVGSGGSPPTQGLGIGVRQAAREVLPFVALGDHERVRDLVQRAQYGQAKEGDVNELTVLFSAARWLGDSGAVLRVGRQWVRLVMDDGARFYLVEEIINQVSQGLDAEGQRALRQYFVSRVVEDPAKYAQLLQVISTLQAKSSEPLVTEDQVLELLDNSSQFWGLPQLLGLLPASARVTALRGKWSQVPVTGRGGLLLDMVSESKDDMGGEMVDFILGHAEEAFREAPEFLRYGLRNLGNVTTNRKTALALLEIWMESHPDDTVVNANRVVMLHGLERTKEALQLGVEIFPQLAKAGKENDYEWRGARRSVIQALTPDHVDALANSLDGVEPRPAFDFRLELCLGDGDAKKALWATVLAQFPDDQKLLTKAINQVSGPQQMLLLDRLMELTENDKERLKLLKRRESVLRSKGFHAQALAVRLEQTALNQTGVVPAEKPDEGGFGMIQVGPNAFVSSVAFGGAAPMSDNDLPKSAKAVCQAVDEGRVKDAAHILRRFWRRFEVGLAGAANNRFISRYSYLSMAAFRWSGKDLNAVKTGADGEATELPKSPSPKKPLPMGGLEDWEDILAVREKKENPRFRALTAEPLLVAELERFLQTVQAEQLDQLQALVDALVLVDEEALGAEVAVGQRVKSLEAGKLGLRGQMELLLMLDRHPDNPSGQSVARKLVQAVSPKDASQVRRLARVLARSGSQEEALRLYRWCATRVEGQQRFFGFDVEEGTSVTVEELVKEAREVIHKDYRLQLVQTILDLSPVEERFWGREQGELQRLKIWEEMLGPEEALVRAREICDASIDLGTGLRRGVALQSAPLFARAGEWDNALRALEIGVCKLAPDSVRQPTERWMRIFPENPGHLSADAIRRLMDRDLVCQGDQAALMRKSLEENLFTWLQAERSSAAALVQGLCVLGMRCEEVGDQEGLVRIAQGLASREQILDHRPLWVADLCSRAGLSSTAQSIEVRLLEKGRLHTNRRVPVLRRILEQEGAAAALDQGSASAELKRVDGLCAFLAETAEAVGKPKLAQEWKAEAAADTEAKQRLKELDKLAKEAAKAKAKKTKGARPLRGMVPAVRLKRIGP